MSSAEISSPDSAAAAELLRSPTHKVNYKFLSYEKVWEHLITNHLLNDIDQTIIQAVAKHFAETTKSFLGIQIGVNTCCNGLSEDKKSNIVTALLKYAEENGKEEGFN